MAAKPNIEEVLVRVARMDEEDSVDEHRKSDIKALLFGNSAPPRRIGRFIDLGVLGHGAMGTVRRAYDERLAREVAIKVVRHRATPRHDDRLLREAQALAQVSHPNVVQIYEVGEVGHEIFIAMELIDGASLDRWHRDAHSWRECLDVYLQAGRGLAAAHAVGLVHRDFKPSNCIRDTEGRVRVLDFGLARGVDLPESANEEPPRPPVLNDTDADMAIAEDTASSTVADTTMLQVQLTASNAVVGTIAYMAPEQFTGGQVGASSDQFSFCVALFEAMYGEPPFSRDPRRALIRMARGTPSPLVFPRTSRRIPRGIRAALSRGLSAEPEARWPSMEALLRELERPLRRSKWRRVSVLTALVVGLVVPSVVDEAIPSVGELARGPVGYDDQCQRQWSKTLLWDDEARAAVGGSLLATKASYAGDSWNRVESELDVYAEHLTDGSIAACRVSLSSEGSHAVLQECLSRGRASFENTVALLSEAEGTPVEHAARLVAALPSIRRCVRPDAWRPPVMEPSLERARIVAALDHALSLHEVTRCEDGLREAAEARVAAKVSNDPMALAQALLVEGSLFMQHRSVQDARARLDAALDVAQRHGLDDVAIQAQSHLGRLLGVEGGQSDVGLALSRNAVSQAGQRGIDPLDRAHAQTSRGQVLMTRGVLVEAQAAYQHAIDGIERELGPDHLELVEAIDGLAQVLEARGHRLRAAKPIDQTTEFYDRSLELYGRSLEIHRSWQGARHPATALTSSDAAAVLLAMGEHARAQEQAQQAVDILLDTLEPDDPRLWLPLNTLATTLGARTEYAKAEEQYRKILPIARGALGAMHSDVARVRFNLARALRKQEKTTSAIEEYRRVLRILDHGERTPADASLAAKTLRRLGRMSAKAGDVTTAVEYYRKGITWIEDYGDGQESLKDELRGELEELTLLQ